MNPSGFWKDATRLERVRKLYCEQGFSASEIAASIGNGVTRNGVIGIVYRKGWAKAGRQEPSAPSLKAPKVKRDRQPGAVNARMGRPKPAAQNPFGAADPIDAAAKRIAQQKAGLATIQAAIEPAGSLSISLIERRFSQCAWPVGPDGQHLCCGARVTATFRATPSYCERHSRSAVAKVQPSRKPITEPAPRRRAA